MKVSIVIPVYNEIATIRRTLTRVQATPYEKEIILVDDGSTDGTRDLLSGLTEPDTVVLLQERNRGKGAARREAPSGSVIGFQFAGVGNGFGIGSRFPVSGFGDGIGIGIGIGLGAGIGRLDWTHG